ncbi:MAG: sensor histidine kinase [Chloroflexaceae bacterium]
MSAQLPEQLFPADDQGQHLRAPGVAYLICNADLQVTEAGPSSAALLGMPGVPLVGQSLTSICLPLLGSEAQLAAVCARNLPHLQIEQINLEDDQGQTRYISLVVWPHQQAGLIVILSDETLQSRQQQRLQQQHNELLLLNEQLTVLNAELEEVSQRKSNMMAIVTHDLRSPLTAVIGYAGILLEETCGPLTPDQREILEAIHQQGQHMRDLLSRLLDLRRLEATELQKRTPVDLNLLLMRAVFSFHDQARLAGVEFCFPEDADEETLIVAGDADILQQAVANLLSNAIKYTGTGGNVTVRLYRATTLPPLDPPLDSTCCWCVIEVADTGPGIAEDDLHRIFDPFFRTDEARVRGPAGSGLGLAIVQMAVRQHHGRVHVTSSLGQGTTFLLLLPCEAADAVGI